MKKVVVIGPESTGKSTLCERLALHYHTSWCPEYAREYLQAHGTVYTYQTLLDIAKGQIALEEHYIHELEKNSDSAHTSSRTVHRSPLLFIDTNMYVMQVWCNFVFGKTHSWILNRIIERKYDLYLLCNVDLPWVKDELREYPDLARREKLYHIYRKIMMNQRAPWADISGNYDERFEKAVAAVEKL